MIHVETYLSHFDLRFGTLRSDTYKLCDKYYIQLIATEDNETRRKIAAEAELHHRKAKRFMKPCIGMQKLRNRIKILWFCVIYSRALSPIKQIDKKLDYLEDHLFEITKCERHILKHKLSHFKSEFKRKWMATYKKRDVFETKNASWLVGVITLPMMTSSVPHAGAGGRLIKSFMESSDRTKRRKTKHLRENIDSQQLTFAAQMSLRASGNVYASKIVKDITKLPTKAKQQCFPKPGAFCVTSTYAEVKLQDILDNTCFRLCQYLDEVFEGCSEEERCNLELIHKWGCDVSQQSQFKQKFKNTMDSDANIFQSSFVPLRLRTKEGKILWQNTVPSSPRYCRTIRIRFIHETKDVTRDEIIYVEKQIKDLQKSKVPLKGGFDLQVEHKLLFTMADGKICNAATNTASTMRCYLCGLTSKF
ncbi:unnamed protein product [Euphydryas editha]|uniref:Transposase n=1 Tax=Euphydryas editha TaxID=104508 RepID=A0AAU9TTA8_EUPED|nr:unnamed protein product [Euphydryas editha]